ncbi:hypothetical protein MPH_08473 [Macrophomina phaseolina MS6]|uniref:Uncharacterized protein n=2 Tax=Macrophomina phaseolina TaxID=35725 RepID=K2QWW2_MACPH|nr:hypothetical protein MPH_08473 [Macrophomina phaseolina MS6]KAH7026908.1 hypothetical protein B0J12DRAFT_685053 [Macrophomina phaseolina]
MAATLSPQVAWDLFPSSLRRVSITEELLAELVKPPTLTPEPRRAPPVPEVAHTDESTHSLIDVDSPHVSSVPSDFESQSIKTETQADRVEREIDALERKAQEKFRQDNQKAKAKGRKAGAAIRENAGNPVVIGNAVTVGALGAVLGFGAYKKYNAGQLNWKLAGAWAGVVGLFGVADYYVSKYLLEKYPTKK